MIKQSKLTKVNNGLDKDKHQQYHFMKRLSERLNTRITEPQYEHIVSCIKNNKDCNLGELKYLYNQSKRLMVFELKIEGKVPVNIIYDTNRKSLVTMLFQQDAFEIAFYYDVFNNKVTVKHDLGFNRMWRLENGVLDIPTETVISSNGIYEVTSEGILFGKRFKFEDNNLYEVMF